MNATQTPSRRQRKPRPKQARSICLRVKPREQATGLVRITVGKEQADYFLTELPADFGRGFQVEKMGLEVKEGAYHVNIDGQTQTCDCKGFSRWSHCKHSDGLAALIAAG